MLVRRSPLFIPQGSKLFNFAPQHNNVARGVSKRSIACSHTPESRVSSTAIESVTRDRPSTLYQLRHSRTFIRECWRDAITKCGINTVIDATAGRGSDTITLGQLVGVHGTVYSLDIQQAALEETRLRYEEEEQASGIGMGKLILSCTSHENFAFLELPDKSVSCLVYNLGWYPGTGADRSIITCASTTVSSLQSAEQLVAPNGIISITAYVGHEGGKEEEQAVLEWARQLSSKLWNVTSISYPNRDQAPRMLICERNK